MKITILLFTIFASQLTTACWPPWLDFELGRNSTLLDEAIAQRNANPATGWTHVVDSTISPLTVWPADPDGLVRFRFCFQNEAARAQYDLVQQGWEVWRYGLGEASFQHGHRLLGPIEFRPNGVPQYCRDQHWNWNWNMPPDTLEIIAGGTGAEGSTGYRPNNYDARGGRHYMRIGINDGVEPKRKLHMVAHEWGHILGLWHEHQRNDRDKYIHFDCKKLVGYEETKTRVEADGYTMEIICADTLLSLRYKFLASDFTTGPAHSTIVDNQAEYPYWPWGKTESKTYGIHSGGNLTELDIHSIMHYESGAGRNFALGSMTTVADAVLAYWNDVHDENNDDKDPPDQYNACFITTNYHISRLDAEAVRELYPWLGPRRD